ncbi:MAG: hydroxymethylbilane synthase [Candidatus Melainabacteria bacterium]|nr:hydroxymethylbilane synthase [Candidatus Melainabacteria bacterium]
MKTKITIGTRSSKLALWQTNYIKEELKKFYPNLEISLKEIKTKGDHITDIALSKIGGKGLFTKEIEDALLNGEIDLAVHSLKDLPTRLPDGLKIGAVLKREEPNDILISRNKNVFKKLPPNSKIGTSSLRRTSQLKALRQDLEYLDLRGNLDTRIRKLEDGEYDAIVLAYAGVKRLGFEEKITEHFSPFDILPAVGQGALAIEIRENNLEIEKIISKLNHRETHLISICERTFLETLQGGCQVPIGAYSEIKENKITLQGIIASLDGKRIVKDKATGDLEVNSCRNIGINLGKTLLQMGGKEILKEIIETHR